PYSPLFRSNSKELSWLPPAGPLQNTDTWPIWPFDGADGSRSRSMDCDYNRANDVLHTSPSGYRLWMLLPGGRFAKERRVAPLTFEGQVFRFDAPGTHIADLNGDRLQDLVWIQSSRGMSGARASPMSTATASSTSPSSVLRARRAASSTGSAVSRMASKARVSSRDYRLSRTKMRSAGRI